ncbi:superfamily I DNA and RNA helicases and helicase subunits-like [Pseudonocardia sp. N23]|nr:superfamily I DNA and RNA helicases and helicase subunits-like [Pseudonocardia sp. N23]
MLDVGPSSSFEVDAHLATFVDRLAGDAAAGPADAARRRIHTSITAGTVPPGLRRLAEALASAAGDGPPRPRHPAEDVDTVADALRGNTLVVLDEFDVDAVVTALGALVRDGRRVAVTAADRAELTRLRDALTPAIVRSCVDALPAMSPAEQRELRRLLATATPERRARRGTQLPPAGSFPTVAEVADLCARAAGTIGGADGLLADVLSGMDPDRRAAVTDDARRVEAGLAALGPRVPGLWTWTLLSNLVHNTHAGVFDHLVDQVGQALAADERSRAFPPVTVQGSLGSAGVDALRRYVEFLGSGGRNRAYFRSQAQRDVQQVLRQIVVGGHPAESADDIHAALAHIELAERLLAIDASCRQAGVPAPRSAADLTELAAALSGIADAARAVGALRHDVLFIHHNSPVAVPDLDSAQHVAAMILEYDAHGSADEAAHRLDAAAHQVGLLTPATRTAPEHTRAVEALRAHDPDAYAAALDEIAAARCLSDQENRCAELLDRLRRNTPRVAEAWEAASAEHSSAYGLAWFVEADRLMSSLPGEDTVDVVLLLGAADLGVDRLLLTAVAPRLAAVVGPGVRQADGPTLLGVMQRASALVIAGRVEQSGPSAQVVHLSAATRARQSAGSARQDPA